jgi:HSP20 family protein
MLLSRPHLAAAAAMHLASGAARSSMDVKETEPEFALKADLPGVTKGDVKIDVRDGVFSIGAQRKTVEEQSGDGDGDGGRHVRVERAVSFKCAMSLLEKADGSAVRASLDSGVLAIRIGKLKPDEQETRRVIEVE